MKSDFCFRMTFGAGHRSCLGWRFACVVFCLIYLGARDNKPWPDRVAEMQAFVFELILKLKFETVEKTSLIRRENCLVMLPMVGGEERKGNQLPLRISIINHSEYCSE